MKGEGYDQITSPSGHLRRRGADGAAEVVDVVMLPRCGLCQRFTLRLVRRFGDGIMTMRLCRECRPVVIAIDIGGVVQAVEAELSYALNAMVSG